MQPNSLPMSAAKSRTDCTGTFEAGAKMMMAKLQNGLAENFFANAKDPLHCAFEAKAVIHSGPGGMPMMGEEARRYIDELADQPRSGKTLAYLHVPFCETRCLYCMFYQNPYSKEASAKFAKDLVREIELWSDKAAMNSYPVHAVYFGGGTPTALEPEDLKTVLKAVRENMPLANDCEITIEGRIHNFGDDKMEATIEGGANRFSLGVQSFDDRVRQSVMRVDGRDAIISRLEKLCSYNEAAVVIDLIYGFPWQTLEVWENDIRTAQSLGLDGVDCYQLNVFEKSPLSKYIANGKLPAAADTAMKADMFAMSVELFTNAQWRRLSNNHWGQTMRERNIYNTLGKSACDCLAFGCGAGGRLNGNSFMMERKLSEWEKILETGQKPVGMLMKPGQNWHLMRTLSSEMESGAINLARIEKLFGVPVVSLTEDVINQWVEAGLLNRVGDWLVQTVAGQFWHVTLAQLLIGLVGMRLGASQPGHRPHGHAAVFSGEKPHHA